MCLSVAAALLASLGIIFILHSILKIPMATGVGPIQFPMQFEDAVFAAVELITFAALAWVTGRMVINAHTRSLSEKLAIADRELMKFRKALDTSVEAIFLADKEGIITFINPGFTALYGYTAAEVVGKATPRILKSGVLSQDVYEGFWKTLLDGQVVRGELKNRTKDGTILDIEGSANAIVDAEHNIIGFIGIQRDITMRKRAEEAFRNERLLLRTLIDNIPDSIYSKDLALRKTLVNAAELHYLGEGSDAAVLGKNDFDVYPQHIAEGFYADDQAVIQSGTPLLNREELLINNKNEKRWLLTSKIPLRDTEGRIVGLVGIGRDITARKEIEETLKSSLALLETILESIDNGILVVGRDGAVLKINGRFSEMWNFPEDILAARDEERSLNYIMSQLSSPDEFLAKVRKLYSEPLAESFDIVQFKDGRVFERVSKPLLVANEPQGRVWSFRDVTERKNMEQELRYAQKMESLGLVAGGIAHDYNNLLAIMMGSIGLAQEQLAGDHPAVKNIQRAATAMGRATELTKQMLAYSGKAMVERHTCDAAEIVQRHMCQLDVTLPKNVALETRFPSHPVYVSGDPGQIKQIVQNLCVNSIEAIGERSGAIAVALSEVMLGSEELIEYGRIMNATLQAGEYVLLTVSDTGVGMSSNLITKIFDPFFTTKFMGRGLGLSAVYGIVNAHKGGITAESTQGAGSVFKVILPAVENKTRS